MALSVEVRDHLYNATRAINLPDLSSEEYEEIDTSILFIRPREVSTRKLAINLRGNTNHYGLVRHKATGTKIFYCYSSRLKRVKRPDGKIKKELPNFTPIRFSGSKRDHPALAPFASYVDQIALSSPMPFPGTRYDYKALREAMHSHFKVYVKD
jgi:hypothetical protein